MIISEKNIIKREFYAGLSKGIYLFSKMLFYVTISIYISAVFSVSASIEWVDWARLNTLFKCQNINWIHTPIYLDEVDYDIDREKWDDLFQKRSLQQEYYDIKKMNVSDLVFVYKRLKNENAWGLILTRDANGWKWYKNGSDSTFFTNWPGKIKPHLNLFHRICQQLIQLLLFDYAFMIMILSCCAGLSLGLCISAIVSTRDAAVQLVPYITIYQIIISKEVIAINPNCTTFNPLRSYTINDILGWDFGSLLSLFTVSRFLRTLAENLLATAKNYKAGLGYIINNLQFELIIVLLWIVLSYLFCYMVLKRWQQ
ncbi:MAG: hypothetical protein OMM_00687 [Candidatus Magnetoglobus multicellularis str. Araruama]|uniref:Uncharacterized protein n=1 Tax=Candidatus Magnetoglobus multicellularis str. Araruama TaxID=890399 RepID=A0A1V1PGA7_9BACT|nr:MAG: hypothetical protein OMM_00687 [Candidatus Magnetoglobus multicellularis str. Araruama]